MGSWCSSGGQSLDQCVLILQVFRVLVLNGVLVLTSSTLDDLALYISTSIQWIGIKKFNIF